MTESNTTEQSTDDIEKVDSGDVVLTVEDEPTKASIARFLVSSKVLSLASPVFAAMFSPNFLEGSQIIQGTHPEITLSGDDPSIMRIILEIVHYKAFGDITDPKMLASLAIHCDKYGCTRAVKPSVRHWISGTKDMKTSGDYGLLLLATHFFRMPDLFAWVSSCVLKDLTPKILLELETNEHLKLMPRGLINDLIESIDSLVQCLHREVQSVEGFLWGHREIYTFEGLDCHSCGRSQPLQARKCHPCKNGNLYPKHCTKDTRVATCFTILRKAKL